MRSFFCAAVALAATGFVGLSATPVSAVTYTNCPGSISGLVDNATGCEISSADQDFLNTDPITVNEDGGFFDMNTWIFGDKHDGVNATSGSYDFTGSTGSDAGNSWLLVFKSGSETTLVGYMVNALSGDWDSPFIEPPFLFPGNGPKDVSHISFYYKPGDEVVIPLPASLPLLLGGLAGLGIISRRRKAA